MKSITIYTSSEKYDAGGGTSTADQLRELLENARIADRVLQFAGPSGKGVLVPAKEVIAIEYQE